MTVENTQNKMPPLQMGTATEYPFTFTVLLQDPTEEEALKAIKANVLQADGTEIELVYGVDYTVNLNTDRIGGTVFVKNVRTSGDYLTIYREYTNTQEVDYQDLNAAPAETFEQCFDKLTMLSQQQQEAINRALKLNVSSTTVSPALPEPIANNTLIWDSEGASLKNYDIIGENNAFKEQVNENFAIEKENIQKQFDVFEDEVNTKIEIVSDAAEKINALDESIALCQESAANAATQANNAATQAQIAAEKTNEILNVKDELEAEIETRANTSLDNLTETGEKHFLGKTNITNCITSAPQRIKYTLVNGTFTLLAGSVVIVPYGTEDLTSQYPKGATFLNDNFKVYDAQFADGKFFVWAELVNDIVRDALSTTSTSERWAFLELDNNIYNAFGSGVSGTADVTNSICYRTDLNKCICYNTSGNIRSQVCCFPFMKVLANGVHVEGSVSKLFNGFGYIGYTVWVDKDVKYLVPDGRNEDGTLKNIECVTNRIDTTEGNSFGGNNTRKVWLYSNGNLSTGITLYEQETAPPINSSGYERWFNTVENIWYSHATNETIWKKAGFQGCVFGKVTSTNDVITGFEVKQPFRVVDYNDTLLKTDKSEIGTWGYVSEKYTSLTLGASGTVYTAPANGKFWVEKTSGKAGGYITMYYNTGAKFVRTLFSTTNNDLMRLDIEVVKGQQIAVTYNITGSTNDFRFIYARGEV